MLKKPNELTKEEQDIFVARIPSVFSPRLPITKKDLFAGRIADNTNITKDEMKKLFSEGESKNLEFAKEKGVIHDIRVPSIPKEAPIISIDFK